jgi:hypothetical protein
LISTLERDANYGQYINYYPSLDGKVLVPDPIWLPANGEELPTLLTQQLVDGPTDDLGDAVHNAFPPGTRVTDVAIEARNARVGLSDQALDADGPTRTLMAAQLVYTLRQVVDVQSVSITVNGTRFDVPDMPPSIPINSFQSLDPLGPSADPMGYAIASDRIVSVDPASGDMRTVIGAAESLDPRAIAVSLDERKVAAVSADGGRIDVVTVGSSATPETVWNGGDVTQPSWDRYGDLWFAVRGPEGASTLRRVHPGSSAQAIKVEAPELERTTVLAVRVAPDGVHLAVIIQDSGANARLLVGAIRRDDEQPAASRFVEIAPQVVSVRDVAWLGTNDLAVVGSSAGRRAEPLVVAADGSRVTQSVETGIMLIAGYGDQPVLAISEGFALLRQNSQISWETIGEATAITYPG